MKVLIVYPDVFYHRPNWEGYFYIGIASLSAVLKRDGHDCALFHIKGRISEKEFIQRIKDEAPDLIGFSSTSHMFPLVKKFADWLLKSEIEVPTICGGIHPTIAPEETLKIEGIDMICRGEGEAALSELCEKLEAGDDISGIQNLWIKKETGEVSKNPLRPLLENLDELPFPDRSIFDYANLYQEREGGGSFLVSRGCPYNCSYCCNHLIRKIYDGNSKPIRFRSVDNVIAEIKEVLRQYPFIDHFVFDDDILFVRKKWYEEFTEKYRQKIGLPFVCNLRANLVDEKLVDMLKNAGCYLVKFGLESGNEEIANKVLKRNLKNDVIRKAFSLCKKAGLITSSFNMVGIPHETPAQILDTIKLNCEIDVDQMQITIFQPYQGTQLADLCKKEGFVKTKDFETNFFSSSIIELDTVTPSQVLMFRDYFKVFVYFYRGIRKLPFGSRLLAKISDGILSLQLVARLLNLAYIPLNYIFRRVQLLKTKLTIAMSGKTPKLEQAVKKV